MKQELGWFMPDEEEHLTGWMRQVNVKRDGYLQYQYSKYEEALKWTSRRFSAIDIGANIGLWSVNMAKDFDILHAFEPVPMFLECWHKNMDTQVYAKANYICHPVALGAKTGVVAMHNDYKNSYGDTFVETKAKPGNIAKEVSMRTLDSFELKGIDLIKIDCEGYEYAVLQGAEKTIRREKPCIIVEQKPGKGSTYGYDDLAAVELLRAWGAELRAEISRDFIFSW